MGTQLKQILRSLCFNGEWKYAVFWKLKHRARMVLTWEDAYYKNHVQLDPLENETLNKLSDGHYPHDSLGLAVAKMSYHVYSLGEGIVGQVAATGKHQWIFADKFVTNSSSSFEYGDGWKTQFSAGIRTVIVVAIVPHGVVQLGSLNKVLEDLKLVNHIREVFFAPQDSSAGHIYSPSSINKSLHLPDISTRSSELGVFQDCPYNLENAVNKERPNVWPSVLSSLDKGSNSSSYIVSQPGIHQGKTVEVVNNHGVLESSMPGGDEISKLLQSKSEICNLERHKQVQLKLLDDREWLAEASGWRDADVGSKHFTPHLQNVNADNMSLYNSAYSADNNHVGFPYFSPDLFYCKTGERAKFDGVDCCQDGRLHIQNPSGMQLQKEPEKKLEVHTESNYTDTSNASFKFSAGSELLEVLGPAFSKQSHYEWEVDKAEAGTTIKLPEGMSSSPLTSDSGSDHLLEAIVANICRNGSDAKSEKSTCKSVQSIMTTEIMREPANHNKHTMLSAGHSIDQPSLGEENTQHCLSSSEVCVARSSGGFSSACPSTCSEQVERSSEPANTNKKRAKPGENCRPRPRDRQLIQDRIKELRELVPSGSKCSIDSLLERTIKHMLFLQSITKHADKLKKCAETKLCNKETGILGSSNFEQGSSWAVEVGSHLKVCTIIVENLNMNGQMLVEMLCEDCSHFLEIAEAIRSLGLTILKGVTESHGEKTWICFVVEGQNNRSMHRMDILLSLVQILQPKTTASSHGSSTPKETVTQPPL